MNIQWKEQGIKIATISATIAFAVLSSWAADGFKGECLFEPFLGKCDTGIPTILTRALVTVSCAAVAGWIVYRLAAQLLPTRHLAQVGAVRGHSVLIAAISPFTPALTNLGEGVWRVDEVDRSGKATGTSITLSGNLDLDIEAFTKAGFRWNGQQFLRGLKPHIESGCLKHLVLIGSPEPGGSFKSIADAETLAKLYCPPVAVHCHQTAIHFEDIELLQTGFTKWIRHFLDDGILEREIILDCTGGNKTTSIAAALTTLHWRNIEFQYVQTIGADAHAIGFNVVLERPKQGLGA